MRKKPYQERTLVDSQQALRVYLDSLLSEATTFTDEEEEGDPPKKAEINTQIDPQPGFQTNALNNLPAETTKVSVDTVDGLGINPSEETDSSEIVLPDWAQTQFQCLSFQVAGITLAAPLEKLNGIVELKQEITELPGYAPWVMGLLPNRGQNVQVVDIAQVIAPDGQQLEAPPANERVKFVILVNSGQFGLAVDNLSQVLTIEENAVRWRSEQSKRPWLAGTIVDQMSAILDIDQLTDKLIIGLTDS